MFAVFKIILLYNNNNVIHYIVHRQFKIFYYLSLIVLFSFVLIFGTEGSRKNYVFLGRNILKCIPALDIGTTF